MGGRFWRPANFWMFCLKIIRSEQEILTLFRAHLRELGPVAIQSWPLAPDARQARHLSRNLVPLRCLFMAWLHGINKGWISAVSYGTIAQAGWNGLTTVVNAKGQVEGTCVATTFASDNVYYYARPASVYASHGYGPVLLAGAEMIKLLKNPAIEIRFQNNTFNYVPKN